MATFKVLIDLCAPQPFAPQGTWIASLHARVLPCLQGIVGQQRGLTVATNLLFGANAPAVRARLARIRTPILPVAYLALLLSCFTGYLALVVHPLVHAPIPGLSRLWSPLAGTVLLCTTLLTYAAACWTDPGTVTKANAAWHAQHTTHDPVLWPAHRHCTTCDLPRPPRCKHCPACGLCVARFDHHCLWLNGCVGANNLRWFLLFLLSNVLLCAYGVYAGLCALVSTVDGTVGATWPTAWSRCVAVRPGLTQLVLCTSVALLALLAMLLQHVWLLARGLTSYEVGRLAGITRITRYKRVQGTRCRAGKPRHASPHGRSMLRTLRDVALPGRP